MRKFAIAGVIAALAVLAIAWNFGSLMVRADPSDMPPAAAPARDLTLRAADGVRIAATYWPGRAPSAPAVLLLHGNGASRAAMANDARWLSRLGYAVLAIDFPTSAMPWATGWRPWQGLCPPGSSSALLSFQSLPRWGVWPGRLSPLTAIRSYRGPVLVIGGGADRYTPPEETRSLFAAAPGPKELLLIDGLSHAQVSAVDTPAYAAHVGAFFARTIGTP
jgi:pimeloyl-ACP methyl ester carboxylesterase